MEKPFIDTVDAPYLPYRRSYTLNRIDCGRVVLFGGCADEKSLIYGDLWLYDPAKNSWSYAYSDDTAEFFPPPRYGHASCFVPKSEGGILAGCLVIFGGRTVNAKLISDMWAWNVERNEWILIHQKGEVPAGCCYSSLTLLENGRLALFGGQTEKSSRGSKLMHIFEDGVWYTMEKMPKDPRRFKHYAWYNQETKIFNIYGGISGHSWHVDVCRVKIEGRSKVGNWKFVSGSGTSMVSIKDQPSIQTELCVVINPRKVVVIGGSYAFVLTISPTSSFYATSCRVHQLPQGFNTSSAGLDACKVSETEIYCWNLLSKSVSPVLIVKIKEHPKPIETSLLSPVTGVPKNEYICHNPPYPPFSGRKAVDGMYFTEQGRWEIWNGEKIEYFVTPRIHSNTGSVKTMKEIPFTPQFSSDKEDGDKEMAINLLPSDKHNSSDVEEEDTMPLLYVRRHKKRTILKRLIDLIMSWEKRGAVEYRKRAKTTKIEVLEDDLDLDQDDMGIHQDTKNKFDYRHFFFTLFRGVFLLFFALAYLFTSRFSVKGKLFMLMLGFINTTTIVLPVVTYTYPEAVDLRGEPALVWGPLILYVLLLLTHSVIEGNWKDTGGTAASLNVLDSYSAELYVLQRSNYKSRTKRRMRGGELITCLIESEQAAQRDPWEYVFLTFVLAPIIGLMKAGLFLLIDFVVVSRVIPVNESNFVHFIYAWAMFLNAVTTTVFLSMLGITAYIYRRQLLLLRLVAYVTSKKDSGKLGIPYLPLTSVENVRLWAAMRSFASSEKSHLPLTSANVMAAFALLLTGVLWIVLLVLVFVDRDRRLLLVPLNISLAFFAIIIFYYVLVCLRQHMIMNKTLRYHSTLLGRESLKMQMAIETKGRRELQPAQNVIKCLADILKIDILYFRFLGADINQNSLNSMLGFFLTLSVAAITNMAIDLGSSGPTPVLCIDRNLTK